MPVSRSRPSAAGDNVGSAAGNRLIRFTADYLVGDLSYEVITDLQNASVADIDDLGPGIDAMGEITDGQGFAIDSSSVYDFDYNTGTGTLLGAAGTYGVHVRRMSRNNKGRAAQTAILKYHARRFSSRWASAIVQQPQPT